MRHAHVADGVVDVAHGVQNRFALLPDAHRLAIHHQGFALAFLDQRQLAQGFRRHVPAGQLAVGLDLGSRCFAVGHAHAELLGFQPGRHFRVDCQLLEHLAQRNVLLGLHVAHDEAEPGVADLAHLVALLPGEVAPDLNRAVGGHARLVVGVAHLPAHGLVVFQLAFRDGFVQASAAQVLTLDTLHGGRPAGDGAHGVGPQVTGLLGQLGLVVPRQVLATPAVGAVLGQHAEPDKFLGLLLHAGIDHRGQAHGVLGRDGAGLQFFLDQVRHHGPLVFGQLGGFTGHGCGHFLSLGHVQLHLAHDAAQFGGGGLELQLRQLGTDASADGCANHGTHRAGSHCAGYRASNRAFASVAVFCG